MTTKEFQRLTAAQQTTLVIAMMVRTDLEAMPMAQLSNPQMKELDQAIRYSIYDAVQIMREMNSVPGQATYFEWLVKSIPENWDIPGRDPRPNRDYSQSLADSSGPHGSLPSMDAASAG